MWKGCWIEPGTLERDGASWVPGTCAEQNLKAFFLLSIGRQQGRSGDRDSFSQFEEGQEFKPPLRPALDLQHAPILTLAWNGLYRVSVTSLCECSSEVTPVTPSMSFAVAVASHHQDSGLYHPGVSSCTSRGLESLVTGWSQSVASRPSWRLQRKSLKRKYLELAGCLCGPCATSPL